MQLTTLKLRKGDLRRGRGDHNGESLILRGHVIVINAGTIYSRKSSEIYKVNFYTPEVVWLNTVG